MKASNQKPVSRFRSIAMSLCLALLAITTSSAALAQDSSADEWEYDLLINGWLPSVKPTLPTGEQLTWTLKDLLKNLDMMAMAGANARKGKLSLNADVLWMNLGKDDTLSREFMGETRELGVDIDLRALPMTLTAGYDVSEGADHRFDLVAGTRFMYINVAIEFDPTQAPGSKTERAKLKTWDAIVGFQGKKTMSDKWYFNYSGDIGSGQSDITWGLKAGFGYNFNKWSAQFGYRYLYWDFKSGDPLTRLAILGPYVAAMWTF